MAAVRPRGTFARLRHELRLRRAERAYDWLDVRPDEQNEFVWRRSRIPVGALVAYATTIVPIVVLEPFMPSRGTQLLVYAAACLALGWMGGRALWNANVRNRTKMLQAARELTRIAPALREGSAEPSVP